MSYHCSLLFPIKQVLWVEKQPTSTKYDAKKKTTQTKTLKARGCIRYTGLATTPTLLTNKNRVVKTKKI